MLYSSGMPPVPGLGVCYYPEHWPPSRWAADAEDMVAMGLQVVRMGEFAWSRLQPEPDRFDFAWLDDAIETLAGAGLRIVLGTPTAAPPRWLVEKHPEVLPVDANGRRKEFGSRRHCDFSSDAYADASRRIVSAMARRYGGHPAVIAWQTDNEYGCHDTTLSYSSAALARFQQWLEARYGSIAALNAAWGNVFWSMEYTAFAQVGLPVGVPAQVNPIHALDFRRFASDQVVAFNRMQVQLLRALSPGRAVLHNFMAMFADFDHYRMGRDLDVAAWDSYPLGATEVAGFVGERERERYARTGHPDIPAFHHDLYRGLCGGRLWVMEQQAGPVNWAPNNPSPRAGMVRSWTWEAFAHGAELVSYFRWRQLPYAQEQMHSGLNRPDMRPDTGGGEARQVAAELKAVPMQSTQPSKVALVFDYESKWMIDILPQGAGFDYHGLVFGFYCALRRLGMDVDVLPPTADFTGRALVVVPTLSVVDTDFVRRVAASPAQFVFGPRCGAKTEHFAIPDTLPPGPLADLLPMRVWRVESLRPQDKLPVLAGGQRIGCANRWRDLVEPGGRVEVQATYADGHPAWLRHGRLHAVTGCFDAALLGQVIGDAAGRARLTTFELPEDLRMRRRGSLQFAFNRGPEPIEAPAPAGARFALGQRRIPPADVAAWWTE